MNKGYLVILGDIGNKHYDPMIKRMKELGQVTLLTDNVFILETLYGSEYSDMEKVRNHIAGKEFGYCLVISITANFSCAWNLPKDKSTSFEEFVKQWQNEKE